MIQKPEIWIKTAYEICATKGLEKLKVEYLAKKVGISKSSFYHHFADLECFETLLFEYHYERCALLSEKEKKCQSIHPNLINILLEHKIDLLFHRQLRIHRNRVNIKTALRKADRILGNYAVMLWAKEINLDLSQTQLEGLFEIAIDDFYMRIHKDNLTYNFLSSYFKNLSKITKQFR